MMFLKFLCLAVGMFCTYFVATFTVRGLVHKDKGVTISAWYLIFAALAWAGYIML